MYSVKGAGLNTVHRRRRYIIQKSKEIKKNNTLDTAHLKYSTGRHLFTLELITFFIVLEIPIGILSIYGIILINMIIEFSLVFLFDKRYYKEIFSYKTFILMNIFSILLDGPLFLKLFNIQSNFPFIILIIYNTLFHFIKVIYDINILYCYLKKYGFIKLIKKIICVFSISSTLISTFINYNICLLTSNNFKFVQIKTLYWIMIEINRVFTQLVRGKICPFISLLLGIISSCLIFFNKLYPEIIASLIFCKLIVEILSYI